MCDCNAKPSGLVYNPWLHVTWEDERNAGRFAELMATFPKATERRSDLLLRTMPLHEDAPRLFVPSFDLWTPPRDLVFGQELAFRLEMMRFADLNGFRRASSAEVKADPKAPCAPCAEQKCGPNVTSEVMAAVSKTKTTFAGWDDGHKRGACGALTSRQDNGSGQWMAAVAWDIVELHNQGWIASFRPDCSEPPCQNTVQVGDQCYYAGSANYVIFGVMCRLCHDYWGWDPRALEYSETAMLALIAAYKGPILGIRRASANYEVCKKWSSAGYNDWPSAAAPAGDRPACAASCPTPYSLGAFRVNWHWLRSTDAQRQPSPTGETF